MRTALRAAGQGRGKKGKQGASMSEWLIGVETAPHHRRFAAELPPKVKPRSG
nr:MAG TPA: hypothetical protein [Caudoviricetes sp.]